MCQKKHRDVTVPTNASWKVVKEFLDDSLAAAKIEFFIWMGYHVESFLTKYQTVSPMLPYISKDLNSMLKRMCSSVIKDEIYDKFNKKHQLYNIDFTDNKIYRDSLKIKLGVAVTKEIMMATEAGLKLEDKKQFFIHAFESIKAFLVKIKESSVNHRFTKNLACIDPEILLRDDQKQKVKGMFDQVLVCLVEVSLLEEDIADLAADEFVTLQEECQDSQDFKKFKEEDRLDELYYTFLHGKKKYAHLWPIIGRLLVLSHGQATVERGFSINKQIMEHNQSEGALAARRTIKDHLDHIGGSLNVIIDDGLRKSLNSARNRYRAADEEKRASANKNKQQSIQETLRNEVVNKRNALKSK